MAALPELEAPDLAPEARRLPDYHDPPMLDYEGCTLLVTALFNGYHSALKGSTGSPLAMLAVARILGEDRTAGGALGTLLIMLEKIPAFEGVTVERLRAHMQAKYPRQFEHYRVTRNGRNVTTVTGRNGA